MVKSVVEGTESCFAMALGCISVKRPRGKERTKSSLVREAHGTWSVFGWIHSCHGRASDSKMAFGCTDVSATGEYPHEART